MRITNITATSKDQSVRYAADITFTKKFRRRKEKWLYFLHTIFQSALTFQPIPRHLFQETHQIWFLVPAEIADTTHYVDAFFIIGTVLALARAENLQVDGKVSKTVAQKIKALEIYYRFASAPRTIAVTTPITSMKKNTNQRAAQFFTLGVDSFYTLATTPKKRISGLVFVDGYDVSLTQHTLLRSIHRRIDTVATQTQKTPYYCQSNLRDLSDSIMNWGQFHGAALAAIGMLTTFQTILISGESFDWPDWGLRFGLDELFTTPHQSFTLYGHLMTRDEKIREIKRSPWFPLFLDHVRVCWKNSNLPNAPYNCSRCQKCLRTALTLQALGVHHIPTFKKISLADLAMVEIVGHVRHEWSVLYSLLTKQPSTNKKIITTLTAVLRKPVRI